MPEQPSVTAILKEYQNKIYRLALSISHNEKDAEDIVQNAFIKIVRGMPDFRNRSRLSTWIYRIAYNEALIYLRKKRRLSNFTNSFRDSVRHLPSGLAVNWAKMPDQELLDKELRQRIDAALKFIPIQYRMPLFLHRIEGFSLAETAQILGIKPGTVKTRLHRAYLMVRNQLNAYFHDRPVPGARQDARCSIWTGFLFDYAQERLDTERKQSFHRHIQDCPRCNNFLDTYLQAIRITGVLECPDVPDELKEKLQTFISSSK